MPGGSQPESLAIIPLGIFGGLLVFVALELGRHGMKADSYPVTILMGVVALVAGMYRHHCESTKTGGIGVA